MRIVSLNAWGGTLWDELARWLPAVRADVLCLQEVTRTPGQSGWTRFSDGERSLPQRANLFGDVAGLLPDHVGTFVASDAGPVTVEGHGALRQDFGVATFVHERLSTLGVASAFVHGSFVAHAQWPTSGRPRNALAVRVHDGTRVVTIVQLHGLRDERGKADSPARRAQAERLAAFVRRVREADDLVVAAGDLNLLPDSETFALLREVGLTDLVGSVDTRTSRYPKTVRHADYLLVSDPGAVASFEILREPEVSDHRPLIVDC